MKLLNKKTGEIVEAESLDIDTPTEGIVGIPSFDRKGSYHSLAELNAEWEDYEEPKGYWFIDVGTYEVDWCEENEDTKADKEIGNYFETKEEAKKAVEKLKAWKRLKDNGFTIRQWRHTPDMNLTTGSFITIKGYIPEVMKNMNDLDLLFGDEE